ncbi:hypothetical protein R5R35_002234 [Gryllus longicercus]|uniref:WD repeat domain-containing protein 83 n=1 Tax=Gryllus longicercus TaxID=2509291 RepID=A0AAN9VMD7_9ORTH
MASKQICGPQPKPESINCLKEIDCKQGAIRAVRFNVDGSYCLTAGADKSVKLWNPYRSLLLKSYAGHGQDVLDVHSSCDNSQMVSAGADRSILLWDVSTGKILRRWRGHAAAATAVRFCETGACAVSGGRDNAVRVWDTRAYGLKPMQEINQATDAITSVRVYEYEILTASVDCKVRLYDVRVGKLTSDIVGAPITCANLTNDGQGLLMSRSDDIVLLLCKDSGELLAEYSGHKSGDCVLESCVDANDSRVISGSACGNIWIWSMVEDPEKKPIKLLHNSAYAVCSVAAHPTQIGILLSASGRTIKLWGDGSKQEDDL